MRSKLNVGVAAMRMCGGAVWGMLTKLRADMVLFAGNTVGSVSDEARVSPLMVLYKYLL